MSVHADLDSSIEALYEAFSGHPLRPSTEPCWHCHDVEEEERLRSAPLRQLPPHDLAGFTADSLMTWGDVVDFKHFLPRIIEILATVGFDDDYPDMETAIGGLRRGEWWLWPEPEQRAVQMGLTALWRSQLASWPPRHDQETVLASLAEAFDDIDPFLQIWETSPGAAPVLHFAAFLLDNSMRVAMGKRLANPWLSERHRQEEQIRTWVGKAAPVFLPRMDQVFSATDDEDIAELLGQAIAIAEARMRQ